MRVGRHLYPLELLLKNLNLGSTQIVFAIWEYKTKAKTTSS